MGIRNEYILAYDIEDTQVRTTIHKQLLAYGLRAVQKSVFWGYINLAELNAIKTMFEELLTKGADKVFITRVRMQPEKLDYSFGYDNQSTFKDWKEYESI